MTVTVDQIRAAADTLEELSRIYEYMNPELGEWSASDLRSELPHLTEYIDQESIYKEIVERVGEVLMAGAPMTNALMSVLRDYTVSRIDD